MPRRNKNESQDQDLHEQQVRLREYKSHKHGDDDPRLPVASGAMRNVTPNAQSGEAASKDTFSRYARNLFAQKGDLVRAIAITIGKNPDDPIDVAYVTEHLEELHGQIRATSRSATSVTELLEKHDLTLETRLVLLRDLLFSPVPAVQLKAMEMIGELDETAKSKRIGSKMEDIFRIARAKAAGVEPT